MELKAAALILLLAVVVGGLLYLPFLLWFRFRRTRARQGTFGSLHVTGVGMLFYSGMLLVIFAGLSTGVFLPASWLGVQVRTLFGALGYGTTIVIGASLLEWVLVRRGARFWYRTAPSNATPAASEPTASAQESADA